jgi:hypothetical protein
VKLVPDELKLFYVVQTSLNTFMFVVELGFESNIPSLFCGDGTNCYTFSGFMSKSYIYCGLVGIGIFIIA